MKSIECHSVIFQFSKHERQTLLDSSLIQLPKAMQQNNEALFMTSVEKARIRNDNLLKVIVLSLCLYSMIILRHFSR